MFDKHFDPKRVEAKHYPSWEASGLSRAEPSSPAKPFTIMMPPPNVTGVLHMGHAFQDTLQDVLCRYQRMRGRDVLWLPGTDHAGISTQMVVARQIESEGKHFKDLGRTKFLERTWVWKEQSGGTISKQLRSLGVLPDWSRERFTMDEGLSKAVRHAFVTLYKDGLIYKDKRLVNWDPKMKTVLSDLEVTNIDVKGAMHYIRYPIEGSEEQFITVATTRPETMLGDTAIVVHPDDERFKDYIGKFAILPIVGRPLPIVAEETVEMDFGTGAMKVTPAHDFNDFEMGKKHDLPLITVIDFDGNMCGDIPENYQGVDRFKARKQILVELEALELLEKIEDHVHAVPHDEKSKKTILEPLLTDQWYCDAPTLAKDALKAVETGATKFVPKQWENTYYDWMRNIQPWCISRQLWWGHQIPAWYDKDGKYFVAESEEEALLEAKAHHGKDVKLTQDEDVLDTWFSSGLWPFSTLGWPEKTPDLEKYYPGDVLVTGFDIIFFWVARMMMFGCYFMKDVPFKTVYTHGLVRDAQGQKMSKTRGNVIDPLDSIDEYGADALRFTMTAMAAQGRDIRLNTQRIEGYRNFATKLWNAARYAQMNGASPCSDFDPNNVKQPVNQWIIAKAHDQLLGGVERAIDTYRFNELAMSCYDFAWKDFCDWYLEFTKPILAEASADIKAETLATTAYILDLIMQALNPVMPFITEEIYENMGQRAMGDILATKQWPKHLRIDYSDAAAQMEWVCEVISEIRSIRSDLNVPAKSEITLVITESNSETATWIEAHEDLLKRMARLDKITFNTDIQKGAVRAVVTGAQFALPVADVIDLKAEQSRLESEIAKLDKELKQIDGKLNNKQFVSNAPDDVVEEQRERQLDAMERRRKYQDALKAVA